MESPFAGRANLTAKPRSRAKYIAFAHNLAYYMSLSCNYSVVMSSLCGSFWEPTVGCNLVSPWLHPVLEEIPKLPQFAGDSRRYHKLIAIMCAARRPTLSPVWAGASLSGLVGQIIDLVRTGTPPLDPNGYFWTGSAQNFLDLPGGTGPYFKTGSGSGTNIKIIERADVWRLLYLQSIEDDGLHYESLPFSPWYPVGATRDESCVLRVRAHESCPRHSLIYSHWTWELSGGSGLTATDGGYQGCMTRPRPPHRVLSPPHTINNNLAPINILH
jgi:hypothetical protein